MTSCH